MGEAKGGGFREGEGVRKDGQGGGDGEVNGGCFKKGREGGRDFIETLHFLAKNGCTNA